MVLKLGRREIAEHHGRAVVRLYTLCTQVSCDVATSHQSSPEWAQNGHVSLPYHVNMPALGFTLTLVFNARVIH